jgi:hypothetical protein
MVDAAWSLFCFVSGVLGGTVRRRVACESFARPAWGCRSFTFVPARSYGRTDRRLGARVCMTRLENMRLNKHRRTCDSQLPAKRGATCALTIRHRHSDRDGLDERAGLQLVDAHSRLNTSITDECLDRGFAWMRRESGLLR